MRSLARMFAAALLTLTAIGSPRAAESPEAPRLSAAWSVDVSEPAGAPLLVPRGDRLAVLTWQGDVVVLDARTGKRRWRKQPRQRGGVSRPALAADQERVVVIWPSEPRVVAYDLDRGREAWSVPLDAVPAGMADCARHRAVVVTHRGLGTLLATAFDPKSGARLWQTPVEGPVVGAGDAYVFTATPSGFGVWPGRLGAVHCATGEVRAIPQNDRQLVEFLAAGDGVAVARHLDPGFSREQICLHRLGDPIADVPSSVCTDTADGEVPAHPLTGALIDDGTLYFSTAHISAHNLDPSPDSWIFARALDGRARWRSPALVSRQAPVDAGPLLWTGFGSTGADDYAFLIDREDGRPVGRLPLRKAPTALAADRERAYVSTYDGRVYAVRLPEPGPAPVVRKPVTPSGRAHPKPAVDTGPWRRLAIIDAHPKSAKTSGSRRPGTADPVAFVDPAGALLAVGGNDDKVRVFDVKSGKRRWISKRLGKDVEAVQAGGGRIHARIYGGRSFTFEPRGARWRRAARIDHGHGWMSGLSGDGQRVVTDTFDGEISAFDALSGDRVWRAPAKTAFDQRGVRVVGQRIVIHSAGALRVFDVGGDALAEVARRPTPGAIESGEMTQAWMIDETHAAWEYCGPAQCVVEIGALFGPESDGGPVMRRVFDVRGAGWVPDVPSTLHISPDRAWLFFFRLGLTPLVVEWAADARIPLSAITEKPVGEYTSAAFSADGRRLALGMHPASWQVTVIERR